jgi:hypothetical protein
MYSYDKDHRPENWNVKWHKIEIFVLLGGSLLNTEQSFPVGSEAAQEDVERWFEIPLNPNLRYFKSEFEIISFGSFVRIIIIIIIVIEKYSILGQGFSILNLQL